MVRDAPVAPGRVVVTKQILNKLVASIDFSQYSAISCMVVHCASALGCCRHAQTEPW